MKPRVLGILAAITAGTLLVGVLVTRGGGSPARSAGAGASGTGALIAIGEELFPGLRTAAAEIVEVRVTQGDKAATIVRDPGSTQWRVTTLGSYPANAERVRDLVRAMVEAKVLERKTALKQSHGAIGLSDPSSPDARSILVEAFDTQGTALARVVLGDIVPGATPTFDPNATTRFVRRADEDQSYLVGGRFPADPSSTAWVVRSVLEVPGARVREVRITPPVAESAAARRGGVVASREREADELAIQDIPTGRSVRDQTQVARLAQAFAFVTLEDVKPASDAATLGGFEDATTFEAVTFDHLLVRARVVTRGEEYWAIFEALPEPMVREVPVPRSDGGVSAPAANTEVSIDDPVTEAAPTNADEPGGATETAGAESTDPSREAARAEAAAINARLAPWIFRLNASKGAQLAATLEDLLTPSAIQGPELPASPSPEAGAAGVDEAAPIPSPAPETTEPGVDPAEILFPASRP